MQKFKESKDRMRKAIGYLGMFLPVVIWIVHLGLLSSISHYYYTSASIFFVGILFAFGLVLISYVGYAKDKSKNEKVSDDLITTIAGIAILITVLIPTACTGSGGSIKFCANGYLFGHENGILGAIHLVSAAVFLFALGFMCIYNFTRNKDLVNKNKFYRTCGILVWSCIGLLVVLFSVEKLFSIEIDDYVFGYTFYLETIAVWAFGAAWLIKGKIKNDIDSFIVKPLQSLITTKK